MAKRYNSNDSKITKLISLVLVIALVGLIGVIVVKKVFGEEPPKTLPATFDQVTTTEVIEDTTAKEEKPTQKPTEQGATSATQPTTEKVVVPSQGENDGEFFSGVYEPYKVIDTLAEENSGVEDYEGYDDGEATLREAFGEAYAGGMITLYKNGTFKDTVTTSSANTGSYRVAGEMIIATYSNDTNMEITVTGWSGGRPDEFIIEYGGGYQVYFGL